MNTRLSHFAILAVLTGFTTAMTTTASADTLMVTSAADDGGGDTLRDAIGSDGGGIFNSRELVLSQSSVTGNSAYSYGGGIYNAASGALVLDHSDVSHNTASRGNKNIYNLGTVTNQKK
jgi:hypothetical protein